MRPPVAAAARLLRGFRLPRRLYLAVSGEISRLGDGPDKPLAEILQDTAEVVSARAYGWRTACGPARLDRRELDRFDPGTDFQCAGPAEMPGFEADDRGSMQDDDSGRWPGECSCRRRAAATWSAGRETGSSENVTEKSSTSSDFRVCPLRESVWARLDVEQVSWQGQLRHVHACLRVVG